LVLLLDPPFFFRGGPLVVGADEDAAFGETETGVGLDSCASLAAKTSENEIITHI
jgi:hypothetical protein